MSLNIKCPNCGQPAVVPDTAIDKRGRCTSCNTAYTIRDAVQGSSQAIIPRPISTVKGSMSIIEKLALSLGIGVSAILCLVLIIYWASRDTWELDNYSQVTEQCEAVQLAIKQSDVEAATREIEELNRFIGDRRIEDKSLAKCIDEAHTSFVAFNQQIEWIRREEEARVLAEGARKQKDRRDQEARELTAKRKKTLEKRLMGQITSSQISPELEEIMTDVYRQRYSESAIREANERLDAYIERTRREEARRKEKNRELAKIQNDRDSFYNLLRDPPYFANNISGHQTRDGAIAALATQFGKSKSWVKDNMGYSNDLGDIHKNLIRALLLKYYYE